MDLPRKPLRGRYLVQNRALWAGLSLLDWVLSAAFRTKPVQDPLTEPKRVLLSMGGHLGDVVIGSSLIPSVRQVWPKAEIGVLTGSWAAPVLEGHPLVRYMHYVDHWRLDRRPAGLMARIDRHATTRATAIREMKSVGYDAAIELYPFFPNQISTIWRAGIPVRVGYTSGGWGPLLTHRVHWYDAPRHIAEYQRDLLHRLAPAFRRTEPLRYSLPPLGPEMRAAAIETARLSVNQYLVLHMGSGLQLKEWPSEKWQSLVGSLLDDGHTLVFTGAGEGQRNLADRAIAGRAQCHNLCDRLNWKEFLSVLAQGRLVVSVDSVTGHLASGLDSSSVVLMSGMSRVEQWRPLGPLATTVSHQVPCAPCFRSRGCADMTCVHLLSQEAVIAEIRTRLTLQAEVRIEKSGGR